MLDICLYNLEQAGVIVSRPTGLSFFTLAGWQTPDKHQLEGFFVPISNDTFIDDTFTDDTFTENSDKLHIQLQQLFLDSTAFNLSLADQIDSLLLALSSNDRIAVDRRHLVTAKPGWIPVTLHAGEDFSQFGGMEDSLGVLIWPINL